MKRTNAANKLNLVPAIREIEEQIKTMEYEYKEKIKPYLNSLEQLRKINTACEKCGGKGRVLRSRACAEDDRPDPKDPSDWIECFICSGTGLSHYNSLESTCSE